MPYDTFTEFDYQNGEVFVDGEKVPGAIKNNKLQLEFAIGKQDNPKVNAILLVEGGLRNTHYQSHQRYLRELEKIRKLQQRQHQDDYEQQLQPGGFSGYIDFFADDEDPSLPKSTINSFLDGAWTLEMMSLGFLFAFFTVLKIISTEPSEGQRSHKIRRE